MPDSRGISQCCRLLWKKQPVDNLRYDLEFPKIEPTVVHKCKNCNVNFRPIPNLEAVPNIIDYWGRNNV